MAYFLITASIWFKKKLDFACFQKNRDFTHEVNKKLGHISF